MPRKRPVQIKAELEETDTTYILHLHPISSAKAHKNLVFSLSVPKEGIEDAVSIRDEVYDFLTVIMDQEEADKIITSHPVRYWSKFYQDGDINRVAITEEVVHDNQDQSVDVPTQPEKSERGFTKGIIP